MRGPTKTSSVPFVGILAATIATLVIEWGMWVPREGYAPSGGAWIEPVAIGAASFVAALATWDTWQKRALAAGVALIPVGLVCAAFAFATSNSWYLTPELQRSGGWRLIIAPIAAAIVGLVLVGLRGRGRAPAVWLAAGAIALTGSVILLVRGPSSGLPLAAVSPSAIRTFTIPAISLSIEAKDFKIGAHRLVYAALLDSCLVYLDSSGAKSLPVEIPPASVDNGFAKCPEVEVRGSGNRFIGLLRASDGTLKAVFDLDKTLLPLGEGGHPAFAAMERIASARAREDPIVETLPKLEAASGPLSDIHDEMGVAVRRTGTMQGCSVEVQSASGAIARFDHDSVRQHNLMSICPTVKLAHGAEIALLHVAVSPSSWEERSIVSKVRGRRVQFPLTLSELGERFAPPPLWIWLARIGLPIAALLALAGVWVFAQSRRLHGWRRGKHLGEGRIELDDGTELDVPTARAVARGPVVISGEIPTANRPGDYRSAVGPIVARLSVVSGSLEDRVEKLREASALLAVTAVGCCIAAIGPLAMARAVLG